MNNENELFARVAAQQQHITILHTALKHALQTHRAAFDDLEINTIQAALESSEPDGRIVFETAVKDAVGPRIKDAEDTLKSKHAIELKQRDDQIAVLMTPVVVPVIPPVVPVTPPDIPKVKP